VVPALRELGLLTVVDRAALEAYCESYATWRQAQDVLDRNGLTYATPKGEPRRRPEVTIAANALKLLRAFASEFGMTPGARTRVKAPIKEPADPFAEFIKASGVTNALDE
jgi:P27 family predicted phage terminase small subunit